MNNFLTNIAVVLVIVLAALFAIPLLVNWDNYRGDFEHRLSSILGAKVELDGRLNVRLLPAPYVHAENLRIGDSGTKGKPLLDVQELTLWISVPPLLKGVVEASQLTLERPQILLPFNDKGVPQWTTQKYNAQQVSRRLRTSDKFFAHLKLSRQLISLRSVLINNGNVALEVKSKSKKISSRQVIFDGINGELSASTLNGPFYFNGDYSQEREKRGLQLVVGAKDKQSGYPVKAKLSLPQQGAKFEIDGRLGAHEKSKPHFKGALKAKFHTQEFKNNNELSRSITAEKNTKSQIQSLNQDDVVLTSKLAISSMKAQFDDIVLQAGSLARPQRVRGQAEVKWSNGLSLQGAADAKLIDLNMIYGQEAPFVEPHLVLEEMRQLAVSQAKMFDKINFVTKADQIAVGRGNVKKFRLDVNSNNGVIKLRELHGELPGNTRVTLSGAFSEKAQASSFRGRVLLRGLEFNKFLSWASPNYKNESKFGRGKFILSGNVNLIEQQVIINDIKGDIGDMKLQGSFAYDKADTAKVNVANVDQKRGTIKLSLFADVINAETLFAKPVQSSQIINEFEQWFIREFDLVKTNNKTSSNVSVLIDLAIGKLILEDSQPSDVRLIWQREASGSGLKFVEGVSDKGLKIQYQADTAPKAGSVRYVVESRTFEAFQELLSWTNLKNKFELDPQMTRRFLPLRLGVEQKTLDDITLYRFDGVMAESNVAFSVLAPHANDQQSKVTIFGGMEQSDGAELLAQFLPVEFSPFVKNASVGAAKMTFSAHGNIEQGFDGEIGIFNGLLQAKYQGKLSWKNKKMAGEGVFRLEGTDAAAVLGLFGLSQTDHQTQSIKAQASFEKLEDGLAINDLKIGIGDKFIYGTGKLDADGRQGSGHKKFALAMESLKVSSLLGVLLDAPENKRHKTQSATGQNKENVADHLWSNRPFTLGVQREEQSAIGNFSITSKELLLGDHLSLANVRLEWRSDETKIEIVKLQGEALGGRFLARGELRRTERGYSFSGVSELKGGQLEEVGASSEMSVGQGQFDLNLSLAGNGDTPKALVASLVGEGFVKITKGSLRQISPTLVGKAADKFISSSDEDIKILRTAILSKADDQAHIRIGSKDFGLQVINGVVSVRMADLGVKPGTIGLNGKVDLQDLTFSSQWSIQAAASKKSGVTPAIYRRVKGKLNSPEPLTSKLDLGDLERHLTLRRKEREIEALELKRLESREERLRAERREAQQELLRKDDQLRELQKEKETIKSKTTGDVLNKTKLPDLVP